MIGVQNGIPHPQVPEAVLFPFDDASIPFTAGVRLHMVAAKQHGRSQIVLRPGPPGAPDDRKVKFYGTVIPTTDELRMWYTAGGSRDGEWRLRVCYATSSDGVQWDKPALGLVEYDGSTENNIIGLRNGANDFAAHCVLEDPQDPDPDRRFKMAFLCDEYGEQVAHVAVAYSPDGLRWTESPHNPAVSPIELSGLIRHNGCYYVNGHGGFHFGMSRNLITYASYDFEHWTQASCVGFQRDRLPVLDLANVATGWNAGEQVHLGAGLWDRGNVILGVYDAWHGHPSGDRQQVIMDLGLVLSHDALHYYEPIPDFRLVPAREEPGGPGSLHPLEGYTPITRGPSLSHGQGMLNWGEETLLFYESWGDGDVRLVRWPRDRLGYFRAFNPEEFGRQLQPYWAGVERHCISCPLTTTVGSGQVLVNVDGVGEHSELTVEVLDEQFRPLAGYSGEACVPLREPGFRQAVQWKDRDAIQGIEEPFRLKVSFGGVRPEDAQLYAVYMA
ncbi:MAG: hypothetical protein CL878_01295 [Dehalococcoidia bacterium]|nr:hypothetical protein [Dehalococcoidia bacterium]